MDNAQSIAGMVESRGRGRDTMLGHLTPGDMVIPRDAWMEDPGILQRVKKVMDNSGMDYRTHMVGSGMENINPETGQPEFNFFSNIFKPKNLIRIAATVAGAVLGGPPGAAIGSGLSTYATGGDLKESALNAGGAYLGSNYLGSGTGDIAGNLTASSIPGAATVGEGLATGAAGSIGSAIGGASFPAVTGALAGNSIAGFVGGEAPPALENQPAPQPVGPKNAPLPNSRPEEASLPSGLGQFAGLDPLQQGTGIATEGVYGGGTGNAENSYFMNMLQRQLINDKGGYEDYSSNVNPTEEAYLHNNLGLQFDPNTTSLLQAIANKNAAAG